jgi:lysylphosphatidylglycerol synthetase-like protein (DUF2156 family)
MTSTSGPALESIPDVLTVDVAAAMRVVVAGDLHLPRRPTADSLAVASELGAALDAWVGPGVLLLNGGVFDLADDPAPHARRILDAHPRLSAALGRFASGDGRRVVFLVETHQAVRPEIGTADFARAAELRIATGAGERLVRVEPGQRFGPENDEARSEAERLIGNGYAGLITGHTSRPELASLGNGFYANNGSGGIVVRPRSRRWGLPSVQVAERQISWVELEAGADLHARLLYSRVDISGRSLGERITSRPGPEPVPKPAVVSAFPGGRDWPAPVYADLGRRRARRQAGAVLAVAGVLNLLSAITPPLRGRLDILGDLVPITVPETASALVAAAGIALLGLSWGVRYGQRRAWTLAVGITALSVVLHIVKGLDVEEAAAASAALAFLIVKRRAFTAVGERPSMSRALATLFGGALIAVLAGTATVVWLGRRTDLSIGRAMTAVSERLVGDQDIAIPGRRGGFLTPTLGAVGLTLFAVAAWLVFRPVVARYNAPGELARARETVRRYGGDTLSYFALRDDKQHWFWKNTLVAFAVHNGVCLVSPDPIGPVCERAAAWRAFREFADGNGWPVAVMGAGQTWLPVYRATGMRDLYVGDEAIVDVHRFNLEGGRMKGLRQAVNRIAKYGYRIEFHDPSHLDPALELELRALMTESRRGEVERGFSMTLGRVFSQDDDGLLLAVCFAPSGQAAAFCQFVPAADIDGYSLDLMRRSEGEQHWNGLLDFVVVRSIEHVRALGMRGLGLNFAVMRSVLANEGGARVSHRIERRMLGWLSDSMQIESLWKYNAKFDPDWHPRYAVYDAPENFLSSAVAVAKAESFCELPLIGRFFAPDELPVGAASEQDLHHDHVQPPAELPSDLTLRADELEAGGAVESDRRLVTADDPSHDGVEAVRGREPK